MPHVVNLDLTAADFRQHPAMETEAAHWLVGAIYGRHLLKTKLRQMRPDLEVLSMRYNPAHETLLESVVDTLDLREWPEPRTISERLSAVRLILRMTFEISEGREPPTWRAA